MGGGKSDIGIRLFFSSYLVYFHVHEAMGNTNLNFRQKIIIIFCVFFVVVAYFFIYLFFFLIILSNDNDYFLNQGHSYFN